MKTYSGFGDLTLIFKIKAELNRSNLACVVGRQLFSLKKILVIL